MSNHYEDALEDGSGIVRLAPCWVPRALLVPGGRLKLDPRDLYALGAHRGGISERWLSSTVPADNGPYTLSDEGLSYIEFRGQRLLFQEAIEAAGDFYLGGDVMAEHHGFNMLCKLFDNLGPIPLHMHQMDRHAMRVGRKGKSEAYYFPPQYNKVENSFPCSFLGLDPATTKDDVRHCLERWSEGDNGLLYHSKAYKLQLGTGWQIDAGILHAPGSLVTYEPQVNSDVTSIFQSRIEGRPVPWMRLVRDVPPEYHHDLDYILDMLDWEANVDPEFGRRRKVFPEPVNFEAQMREQGYSEMWIAYGTPFYSAKELTVFPKRSVVVRDAAAYGLLVVQGCGSVGQMEIETPSQIRLGQMTRDELFVSASAARNGVLVKNASEKENLVILKHFGPGNPDSLPFIRAVRSRNLSGM